ncbi:hypothetical protein FOZ76_14800 [Verticiella sediminum]|uniref:Acyl-CoA dehydrogenase n=1 Tax=Verticiella sediminum TaxID=1247510 RepID=A0A556AIG0_9BURK|nr:acyl-CoA dehydrogenase family protein [Verticiella sediminum]TSH92682.1 hypothetical protein FOZ76_14800 [Verticiella sediminum]
MQTVADDTLSILRDSARDFFAQSAARFTRDADGQRRLWNEMGAMGWLGVAIPESLGGSASGLPAAGVIALELGRAARVAGFAESVALGAVLARSAHPPADLIEDVAAGTLQLALPQALPELDGGRAGLLADAGPARIGVIQWTAAQGLVLRELGDAARGQIVPTTARASHVLLTNLADERIRVLAPADAGRALWEEALATHRCLAAAQLIGAAQAALAIAVDYARVRMQFGHAIGAYQAVQHALVDMLATSDAAELLSLRALSGLEHQADDRFSLAAAAAAFARDTAWAALMKCYDVLGGIGFIEEHPVNFITRAVLPLLTAMGSAADCDDAVAAHVRSGHWLTQPLGACKHE